MSENKKKSTDKKNTPLYISISIIVLFISISYLYLDKISPKISSKRRIIGIGDLHGDLENTIRVLEMAKIINSKQEWIAGTDIMVQTGDVVDRGKDARKIYKLIQDLKIQARASGIYSNNQKGGDVLQLLGNHEIMNLVDLWSYVSQEDILEYGGLEERKKAWNKDTGYLGSYLKKLNISVVVESTIFVHGGIHPEWAKTFGLEKLNFITNQLLMEKQVQELQKSQFLFDPNSPTWYRGYAQLPEDKVCPLLTEALQILNVERMVVGHTAQLSGRILSKCDGRFIDIDVGISSVYGGHIAALEIYPDYVNALYPSGPVPIKSK
jgi:hypothetical protein